MISTFNLSKLGDLLRDFYTMTQIRITVFNDTFEELIAYPEDISSFCQMIRSNPVAEERCHLCDKNAFSRVAGQHTPYLYRCHAGLTECVTPIYMGNILIGYLFFGQVFSYPSYEAGWKEIEQLCKPYHLNMETLEKVCQERPLITRDYISSASHILEAVAAYLCMERLSIIRHQELPVQIDSYISEHYTEDISVATICEKFQIGKTQLYQIAGQCYGKGIAEHIRNLRIEKAKHLLVTSPELRIGEISAMCGFNDYNYFITLFTKNVGVSPKIYRNMG